MKLAGVLLVSSIIGIAPGCCELGSAVGRAPGPASEPAETPPTEVPNGALPEPEAAAPDPAAVEPLGPVPSVEAPAVIEREVRAVDLETWRAAPGGILRSTEMAPASGETGDGARLFGIRAGDPMAELGFQNGDIVHSLNGMSVSDEESLRGAFEQLRVTPSYDAEIIRAGVPETLHVTVGE
jgi:membrane-associated protease RseP (regulator of RpoE activity)